MAVFAQIELLGIACDDESELQQRLNDLYQYQDDVLTKTYHRSRIALFQRLLQKLILADLIRGFGKALDIGCNAGFYAKVVSDFGFKDVLGIDISAQYVAKANQEFRLDLPGKRIAFEAMDAANLIPAENEAYDFILCTEVIEHTDKPADLIKSIMTLLRPGGAAIISLPNCLSLGYFTTYVASLMRGCEISRDLREHLSYPFYKGPSLFKSRGARVVRTAGVNCLFNAPVLTLLHGTALFEPLNALNFWLSSRWPLKCLSQFFFFVVTKDS